ncbi:MAG: ABC transporter substrate-binding protein [Candidatus Omnitrophica bacterium]|nr:ABC transporter substrate-binding protein [Candidatus Omnitrophota bacterium]
MRAYFDKKSSAGWFLPALFVWFVIGFLAAPFAWAQTPERIVSLNLCADELLLRVAHKERIAAVTVFASDPKSSTVWREAEGLRAVKGTAEEVTALNADYVVAGFFSPRETLRFLKKKQIPVLILKVPSDFEDIRSNIRRVAQLTGQNLKGEELIRQMNGRLQVVSQSRHKDQAKPGVIFFQIGGYVPGADTFENAIIEAAGADNLAKTLFKIQGYGRISLEELIRARPDLLVFSDDHIEMQAIGRELLEHPAIQKTMAGTQKMIIPGALLNCGSPASVEAVEMIARELEGIKL